MIFMARVADQSLKTYRPAQKIMSEPIQALCLLCGLKSICVSQAFPFEVIRGNNEANLQYHAGLSQQLLQVILHWNLYFKLYKFIINLSRGSISFNRYETKEAFIHIIHALLLGKGELKYNNLHIKT